VHLEGQLDLRGATTRTRITSPTTTDDDDDDGVDADPGSGQRTPANYPHVTDRPPTGAASVTQRVLATDARFIGVGK